MSELANPHDKFFKELFGQPGTAMDFVANYLPPAVVALLDLTTLTPEKDSFIDNELREHFSDLLYRVQRRAGGEVFLYLLFEHKSAPSEGVAFQLLRYQVRFWEQQLAQGAQRLPVILPIVFYHGTARWEAAPNLHALVELAGADELRRYVPDYEYLLCDLSVYPADELKGQAILRVGLEILKSIFTPQSPARLAELFGLLLQAQEQSAIEFLRTVLLYLSHAGARTSVGELKTALNRALEQKPDQGEHVMQTIFDEYVDLGLQKGLQQGLQQGLLSLTLRQIQHQVGPLAEDIRAQISAFPAERLEMLGEALLDFRTPNDLTEWLHQHGGEAEVKH